MHSRDGSNSGGGKPAPDATVSTGDLGNQATAMAAGSEIGPGTMVGEYRIDGLLGQGGMGRVYAAVHPVIEKRAAVKVLHPALSADRDAIERFVQEARSVNQIGHPNIVDIFAFGTMPDGRHYFVMERLQGESLRDRMMRAPMMMVEALEIVETVTLPLEAAHKKQIVHRDLKPDNIFLVAVEGADRPQVKLLDFGIAKLMTSDGLRRTQTGNMLGTPAYVSPEQARAEGVDYRTDIYALGAMLFELLTARMVFPASNAADMVAKHLFEPPSDPATFNPHVPPQLGALVVRMLAKSPDQRPTLAQIREQLRDCRLALAGGMRDVASAHASAVSVPRAASPAIMSSVSGAAGAVATATPAKSRVPIAAALGGLAALAIAIAIALTVGRSSQSSDDIQPTAAPASSASPPVGSSAVPTAQPPSASPQPRDPATAPATPPATTPTTTPSTAPATAATGEPKPIAGEAKPGSGEVKPGAGDAKPVAGEAKPVAEQRKPAVEAPSHVVEQPKRTGSAAPVNTTTQRKPAKSSTPSRKPRAGSAVDDDDDAPM